AMCLLHAGRPLDADADAAGDADRRVDDEELAVVARDEPEEGVESWRAEDCDLDAASLELLEKVPRDAAHADPVEQQPHPDAASDGAPERLAHAPSDLVGSEDVALEIDRAVRLIDQFDHRLEGRR